MIIWLSSTFFTTINTKLGDFIKDKVTLITHRYISGYIKIKNSGKFKMSLEYLWSLIV